MRKYCLNCCRKHLAQAMILIEEARHGYPLHMWLAIGHLAEASSEIESYDLELAKIIRLERKEYEEQGLDYSPSLLPLIERITNEQTKTAS